MKRLGTVSEAREYLGLPDGAAAWEMVARGELVARRGEDPENPDLWTVYLREGHDDD